MTALRNATAATYVAFLFLFGAIGLPTLHLAFHEIPHSHDGAPPHHHHNDAPPDPRHGDGSLAHFSQAITEAPVCEFTLPSAGIVARVIPAADDTPRASSHVEVARFRGPPVRSC